MINENLTINGEAVSSEEDILSFFDEDTFECVIDDYSLNVEFSSDGNAFIVWCDSYNDEVSYYDNGSGSSENVDLIINVCPEERMMCYDFDVLKDIVLYFCETGMCNPDYDWIEETFGE